MEYSNRGLSWKFIIAFVAILIAVIALPTLIFNYVLGGSADSMMIFLLIDGTLSIFLALIVIGVVYLILTLRKRRRDENFAQQRFFTTKRIILISLFTIVFLWTGVVSIIDISDTVRDLQAEPLEATIFVSENNALYGNDYSNQLKFRYETVDEEISSMEGFDITRTYTKVVYHLSNMEIKAGNVYKMIYYANTGNLIITEIVRSGA